MPKHDDFVLLEGIEFSILCAYNKDGKVIGAQLVLDARTITPEDLEFMRRTGIPVEAIKHRMVFPNQKAVDQFTADLRTAKIQLSSVAEHGEIPKGFKVENIDEKEKEK